MGIKACLKACLAISIMAIVFRAMGNPAADFIFLKQTIALPGVEGRIDHFASDTEGRKLFVCALGNNSLEVIDLKKGERIHSIRCPGSPQGVAYSPETDRLLVANDTGGICQIFDPKSFQKLEELDFKDDADNVRYEASNQCFYIGFGSGGIGIVNAPTGKVIGSISLPGHPEAFDLEKSGNRIFVNIPTSPEIAVVDRQTDRVVTSWKTDSAFGNFPMALDPSHHRLFVGCRIPARLVVLDTDSGKIAAKLPIGGDTDDVFYDQKRHHLYVVCGEGRIEIIDQADANSYTPIASVPTAKGTRTGLFVPELDTLFVAVPRRGTQPAEIRCYGIK